jgi:hypothetical protein
MCLFDQAMSFRGQMGIYWSGQYEYARDGNPVALWLLQQNPIFFGAGMLGWIVLFSTVILLAPRRLGLILSMSVLLGHTWGSCSWLYSSFSNGYWFCLVLVVLAAFVTVICWDRLYRNLPRLVLEPAKGGAEQTGNAGPSRQAAQWGSDKALFIALAGLVMAEVVIAAQIPVFHHVLSSRTGPLKAGIEKVLAKSRGDSHPGFSYRLLRETGSLLHDRFVGRPWNEVLAEMEDQGIFRAYETRELFQSPWVYHHLLAVKDAYVSPNGLDFDLKLEFAVKVGEGMKMWNLGDVTAAEAQLEYLPKAGTAAKVAALDFPASTFLGKVLATPEVKKAARNYPILQAMQVSFGKVGRRAFGYDGVGYSATVELGGDPKGTTGERLCFQAYVEPQPGGENVDLDQLLNRQTDFGNGVGEPFYKGGSSWGPH